MQKQTISDFSGGIQESFSPDDFSGRQWSQLKGIVPVNQSTFQSQWPAQSLSDAVDFNAVFPLESPSGTFLVGLKLDGTIWWAKVPPTSAVYTVANDTVWYQLTAAENVGIAATEGGRAISVYPNQDFRFITGLDFEVYKYIRDPFPGRESDFTQDLVPDEVVGKSRASVSGVLIGCRRNLRFIGDPSEPTFKMFDTDGDVVPTSQHSMLVAYVDPRTKAVDWTGSSSEGVVKIVSFPHFRRWPTYKRNYSSTNPDGTPIENWPAVTVDSVLYAAEEKAFSIVPYTASPAAPTGAAGTFLTQYPYLSETPTDSPGPDKAFHPYTYLDLNSTLLPGRGIIPRGNIGAMWNNQLIVGDIEYRSDKAFEATDADGKVKVPANKALIGNPALTDGNTEAHRGSLYYSLQDIDIFDPRNVVGVSGADARIAGMHMLDSYLVCVTTHNGPNDGVISLSGNLGQLISYSGTSNPFAIRRQLIRGGVGVADYEDKGGGHISQTCLWPEAGNVVFIDKFGGIYSTDGRSCDKIDRYGPKQPSISTYRDHVAAVDKHLIAWRDGRLLVMTLLESNGQQATGCWTELVPPMTTGGIDAEDLRSMVGSSTQLFMVVKGKVWRYSINGPAAERGRIDNTQINIVVSTATLGDHTGHRKTNWHRVGISFYTETTCAIDEVYIRGEAMLLNTATNPNPNANPVPSYTIPTNRSYTNGHYELVCPAGIGPQTVMSARFTFTGNIILKGVSFWASGGVMERGEKA